MGHLASVIAVVSILAVGACEGDAPASESASAKVTGPAGQVVGLTGSASATRDGQTRDLAVGSEVFADDEVETADGAEIAVVLAHNNARWSLTGGQKRRVDKSVAWRAEKQTGAALASADENRTAAAGRHTEREAASSAEVAPAEARGEEASSDDHAAAPGGATPVATGSAPPARKKKSKRRKNTSRGGGGDIDDLLGEGVGTIGKGGGSGYGKGSGGLKKKRARRGKISKSTTLVQGSLARDVVNRVIRRHGGQVRVCYEKRLKQKPNLSGKVVVDFVIAADGSVKRAKAGGMDETVAKCIAGKVRAWKFPAPKGGGVVVVKYPFVFQAPEPDKTDRPDAD